MSMQHIIDDPQHHAYIVFGYAPDELGVEHSEGLFVMETEKRLGVDEVRELQQYAFQSTDVHERKIVLSVPGVSHQAQNALLKVMEEVGDGTYFFLCLPQGTDVLSTLLSRCYIVSRSDVALEQKNQSEHFPAFISASAKERLAMLDAIWDIGEGARHSAILQLLQDIEQYIHQSIKRDGEKGREKIMRYKRVTQNLRSGIYNGALHKGTLQALAFCA